MRFLLAAVASSVVSFSSGCTSTPSHGLEGARWVDLTHAFSAETVYWPTASGFEYVVDAKGRTPGGWWYESNTFRTSEHGGTHLDAPCHFAEGAHTSDQVPIEQLVGPACVVDVRDACTADRDYQVTVDGKGKRIRVDGKDPRGLPNYFKGIKAVSFTPNDLRMVDGGPEGRRDFLDRAAFTLDSSYLGVAKEYRTALRQKNALLRDGKRTGCSPDKALVGVWNDRLIMAGTEVIARRVGFLERFAPTFRAVHEGITGAAKGYAEIRYRGPVGSVALTSGRQGIEDELRRKVEGAWTAEVRRGHATVGPHRDDWELRVGGEPLRSFGSQGQVRSAALAMRMAVMEMTKEAAGVCPLFLLDDVSSELDAHRNRQLMDRLADLEAQVFVTTTSLSNLHLTRARTGTFRVRQGVVTEEPPEGS